ncbi:MAG: hypothetical protein GXY70_07605 [Euryarchaeota archaeon]|nr:hypothetical protein [Euryarchaeota archaeon]
MKGISSRTLPGTILGWVLAFEGFFALSISGSAHIDGIGTITASTFNLAAAQLVALGIFISAIWAFKIAFPLMERPALVKLFNILAYLAMAIVALEGLAITLMAGDVSISGLGGVGKRWIALTGAQLFAIGLMSLRLWRLRNSIPANWLADLLGSMAAVLLAAEGLTAMGIAGNATIQGFGGILERTVFYGGAGLLALGLAMFAMWSLLNDPWAGKRLGKLLKARWSLVILTALGAVIMGAAIAASTVAGTVTVEGSSGASKIYVVAGIAQLFGLGLISPILWKLSLDPLDRSGLYHLISSASLAVLAIEGVFAMGLAANTNIEGLGGILEQTFRMAGAQLLVLSGIGILAWLVKDSPLLSEWPKRVVSSAFLISSAIIALEGIAVIVMAVNIRIDGFSGVGERYVLLGGVQMLLLASLALLCWSRTSGTTANFRTAGTAAAAFLVLMMPFALLL